MTHPPIARLPSPHFAWVALLASIALGGGCSSADSGKGSDIKLPDVKGGLPDNKVVSDSGNDPESDVNEATGEDGTPVDEGGPNVSDSGGVDSGLPLVDTGEDPFAAHPDCQKLPDCQQTGYPYCSVDIGKCVECLQSSHCIKTTGFCKDKKCKAVECQPKSQECNGNSLQICNDQGDGFDITPCPDDHPICYNDKCVLCQPDELTCSPPEVVTWSPDPVSTQVQACDKQGSDLEVIKVCPEGQFCLQGDCFTCYPDTKSCDGTIIKSCSKVGDTYDWVAGIDCALDGNVCFGGTCINPCSGDIKSKTNVGCDYWAVDLDNAKVKKSQDPSGGYYDAQNAQYAVIISNTDTKKPASVKVEAKVGGETKSKNWTVPPGSLQIINLPDPSWGWQPLNQDGTSKNTNVYRITSSVPIVAYQFNPLENVNVFSNDASLLLPSNSLGKEYLVMTREQSFDQEHNGDPLRGYFTVVATTKDTTKVDITVTATTLGGAGIPALKPGQTYQAELEQGEVLNIETDALGADLTGSKIKADQQVAVFGGSEAANAPNSDHCIGGVCQYQGWQCASNADCPKTCCADHLEEQLFPTNTWGKVYAATKLAPRGKENDSWRILAREDETYIETDPVGVASIPLLSAGQWFEFESKQDFVLIASKPILVGQFMQSQDAPNPDNDVCTGKVCKNNPFIACDKNIHCPNMIIPGDAGTGDPALMLAVAKDQLLNSYVFLVPNKYEKNYVNIVAKKDASIILDGQPLVDGSIIVDGKPVTVAWTYFTDAGDWKVMRYPFGKKGGVHNVKAELEDDTFGITVYGYSQYVSYGYPGGAGL